MWLVVGCTVWLPTAAGWAVAPRPPSVLDREAPFRRLLWVTRWDYRSAEDIQRICYNAASARFTDILFQVRGEGTVFYRSRLEPWAWELSGSGPSGVGRDPGWDPLAEALRSARRYGLRVHAYLNVLPGWAQSEPPPASSGQLLALHPEWFMVDRRGRRMHADGSYAFLDPGVPAVRQHLARLAAELVRRYPVHGVHLDYIRYPFEQGDYSYGSAMLAAFKSVTGGRPSSRPEQWDAFRRRQITETVEAISRAVRANRPGVELSAAVLADAEKCRQQAFQSPGEWIEQGLLDAIAPMAYNGDMVAFETLCRPFRKPELRSHCWPGIYAAAEKNPHPARQVRRALGMGFEAVAVFAYRNLFDAHRPTRRARAIYEAFVEE